MARREVDLESLDLRKLFVYGTGMFTAATMALYPLSVIKTQQMALDDAPRGLGGAWRTAARIVQTDGAAGLYRGIVPSLLGSIPARVVYLSTLETVKAVATPHVASWQLGDASSAFAVNFIAGGCASLSSQAVVVPLDVVTQRLMLGKRGVHQHGAGGQLPGGIGMVKLILRQEGVTGLYRGFFMSIATFVPSSSMWWASYGFAQRRLWQLLDTWQGETALEQQGAGTVAAVQAVAAVSAAFVTNPLDVIKTRVQTAKAQAGSPPTVRRVVRDLLRQEGPGGFLRGALPRMTASSMWGTVMLSTYELLKRICAKPDDDALH